jgi:hypothetical protein
MIKLKEGVTSVGVEGACIVVDPATGKYMSANRVAYEMLAGLAANQTEAEIVANLSKMFNTSEDVLYRDFSEFQQRLVELKLVETIELTT